MQIFNTQIRIDDVLPDIKVGSKKQVFQMLSQHMADRLGICERDLLDRLLDFERRAPSGIGDGVAIPHLKLRGLERPYTAFARLGMKIDFQSVDGEFVDLVCVVLSPEKDGPYHLRRLSRISRLFRDREFCDCLRTTDDADAVRALLTEPENRMLAA